MKTLYRIIGPLALMPGLYCQTGAAAESKATPFTIPGATFITAGDAKPSVALNCEPSGEEPATPTDLEAFRQDYACFLAGMEEVANLMQAQPYSRGVLQGTVLQAAKAATKGTPAVSANAVQTLQQGRRDAAKMSTPDLEKLAKAYAGARGWQQIPGQLQKLLTAPTIKSDIATLSSDGCPADIPFAALTAAKTALVPLTIINESYDDFGLSAILVGTASALVITLEAAHEKHLDCVGGNFEEFVEEKLTALDDDKRYTDDTERATQTKTLTDTLKSHADLKTAGVQTSLINGAAANKAALETYLATNQDAQTERLKTHATTVGINNTDKIVTALGAPTGPSVLADLKASSDASRQTLLSTIDANNQIVLTNLAAARNLIYANDNANATRSLSDLATRTETLRVATCEAIRLEALSGAQVSECPSCADQPGYPYGPAPLTAASRGTKTLRASAKSSVSMASSTSSQISAQAMKDSALETNLLSGQIILQLCLPASRGGSIEQVKALVWRTLGAWQKTSIASDIAPVRALATRADKLLAARQYVAAYRQYALAYKQLAARLK